MSSYPMNTGPGDTRSAIAVYRPLILRVAICIAFIAGGALWGYGLNGEASLLIAFAAGFGAYMALNIGANDVANNVGPAVGARVLTLGSALLIAGIFEAAGAIIAGGDVVGTVRSGIIHAALIPDPQTFVWLMMAALLAAAIWLNLATAVGAPISTTHSIVGGVMGGGIAAAGLGAVNWPVMGNIAASWVISPVMGAGVSAAFLYFIERAIIHRPDIRRAGRRIVPLLVGGMAWAFATYLMLKGLSKVVPVGILSAIGIGFLVAVVASFAMRRHVEAQIATMKPGRAGINRLLPVPLGFAAALLSFAHGSNDVANAIGPLAAIVDILSSGGEIAAEASVPLWIILLGAGGIALGLALFGPRIIRRVGTELTKLDPMRAYCIAMAAALTVILASQLGLPVSTTHVSVGAVLGVGFLREYMRANYDQQIEQIKEHHAQDDQAAIDAFLARFTTATMSQRSQMLRQLKQDYRQAHGPAHLDKKDRKALNKAHKQALVKRGLVLRIFAAWIITVPATALIAAFLFYFLRGLLMP